MGQRFGVAVALLLLAAAPDAGAAIGVQVQLTNDTHEVKAVDPSGTVYGLWTGDSSRRLYASTDGARTWSLRGTASGSIRQMMALSDGTLLADTMTSAGHSLSRSTDGGRTWRDVLFIGDRQMLSPRSIEVWGDEIFFAEYRIGDNGSQPVRLWVSGDAGVTWSVRYTFQGHRHAHAVRADPYTGDLWVFMGDSDAQSALLRSRDGGRSWTKIIGGQPSLGCDGVFTPEGLVYGQDISFLPWRPKIVRLSREGQLTELASLPAPGYSMMRTSAGAFLAGATWEPDGDLYPPGEEKAHLFGSADGVNWTHLLAYRRVDADEYARADVFWELPSGEVLLQLRNVEPVGSRGYQILKITGISTDPPPPPPPPPPEPGEAVSFSDDFDACSSSDGLGSRWDTDSGFYCVAARARGEAAGALAYARTNEMTDMVVSGRVRPAGSTRSGLVLRGSNAGYYAARLVEGEGVELVRVNGGATEVLARATRAIGSETYRLSLSAVGDDPVSLRVDFEGTQVLSASDGSGSRLLAGRGGLLSGTDARTQFDDFVLSGASDDAPDEEPPPDPPAASFSDDFDACLSSTDLGERWTVQGRWYCRGARARGESAGAVALARALLPADVSVQARVRLTGVATGSGVVARADGGDFYAARFDASGRVEIVRVEGSRETVLASVPHAVGEGGTVRLEVTGQSPVQLNVLVDGVPVASATDSSPARRLSGSAGLLSGTVARTQFDDFVASGP